MAKLPFLMTDNWGGTKRVDWLKICFAVSIAALIAQLVPHAVGKWREWPWPGRQVPGSVLLGNGHEAWSVHYTVYLPENYSRDSRWPLLLFLHGSGQRGENLRLVTKSGPPFQVSHGRGFPFVLVSPQCRAESVWQSSELLALLDHVESEFSIDPDRVYVAGYSMGGNGAWNLACTAPDRFAAVVPVAGGGDIDQAERLTRLPIWAFHGANDDVVPLEASQRMVESVQAHGGNAGLTVFDDEAHDICNLVFSRNDLYTWLLQQSRSAGSAKIRP